MFRPNEPPIDSFKKWAQQECRWLPVFWPSSGLKDLVCSITVMRGITHLIPRACGALPGECGRNPWVFVGVVPKCDTDAAFNGFASSDDGLVVLFLLGQESGLRRMRWVENMVNIVEFDIRTVDGSVILMSNSLMETLTPKATNCSMFCWMVEGTSPTIKWPSIPIPSIGTPSALSCLTKLAMAVDFAPVPSI